MRNKFVTQTIKFVTRETLLYICGLRWCTWNCSRHYKRFIMQAFVRVYLLRSRLFRNRANQNIPRKPKKIVNRVIRAVVFISVLQAC